MFESLQDYGHKGIHECLKVRYLNGAIKTIKLDSVKSIILASTTYNKDFDGCVTLYKNFIKHFGEEL